MNVNVPFPLDAARQAGDIFAAPVFFAVGSAPLPGIAFAGDPDTGAFSPGADIYAIGTGGFERIRAFGGAVDDGALQWQDGVAAAVSAGGAGAIRYNDTTKTFQRSVDGGPYADFGGGGVTDFLGLSDTPGSYAGAGSRHVRVNAGATALEFLAASAAYTVTNVTTDRTYNANITNVNELADVLGTVIADLQAGGTLG
jgi:hypothetical protein